VSFFKQANATRSALISQALTSTETHRIPREVGLWPEADELDDTIGRQVSRVERTYWPRRCQGSLIGEAIIGGIYVQE
jgi:hypothetical protein